VENLTNYGLIFFDPELRQGLAHNNDLVRKPAQTASVRSGPGHWFAKAIQARRSSPWSDCTAAEGASSALRRVNGAGRRDYPDALHTIR
jgi:hypothetical protein